MNTRTTRNVVDGNVKQETCDMLQSTLIELTDLALQAKQAHWAVVGEAFKAVHEFMDEVAEFAREHADEVAERMLALGEVPDGSVGTVNAGTPLPPFPRGNLATTEAAGLIAEKLLIISQRTRDRIGKLSDEPVSQDLLIEVTAGLEKLLWMARSQAVAAQPV